MKNSFNSLKVITRNAVYYSSCVALIASCFPTTKPKSKIKEAQAVTEAFTLSFDALSKHVMLLHVLPDGATTKFTPSELSVSVPQLETGFKFSQEATQDGTSKVELGTLGLIINYSASSPKGSVNCLKGKLALGKSALNCGFTPAPTQVFGEDVKLGHAQVAQLIRDKGITITEAVELGGKPKALPADVKASWLKLESDVKIGGAYFGRQDAIYDAVRALPGAELTYDAEAVARVLAAVYEKPLPEAIAPGSPDTEIANYIKTHKGTISDAVYMVETNILNKTLPDAVKKRWFDLESNAKVGGGYHGQVDAIASVIASWNIGFEYEAEAIAQAIAKAY